MNSTNTLRTRPQRSPPTAKPAMWAAIAVMAAAGAVQADVVNLSYTGPGNGRTVTATLGARSWDVFAGRLNHQTSGGSGMFSGLPRNIVTFCVDILQTNATNPSPYAQSSVATLSGNAGMQNLGYGKQQAIYDLYQAAANRQFTLGLDYATAFQVALWEVVYDFSAALPNYGLNAASGNFRATTPGQTSLSNSITTKVQFLLSSVGSGAAQTGLFGLRSTPYQDQLYAGAGDNPSIPLPPAAWQALGGLGMVALFKWRRRRA